LLVTRGVGAIGGGGGGGALRSDVHLSAEWIVCDSGARGDV